MADIPKVNEIPELTEADVNLKLNDLPFDDYVQILRIFHIRNQNNLRDLNSDRVPSSPNSDLDINDQIQRKEKLEESLSAILGWLVAHRDEYKELPLSGLLLKASGQEDGDDVNQREILQNFAKVMGGLKDSSIADLLPEDQRAFTESGLSLDTV